MREQRLSTARALWTSSASATVGGAHQRQRWGDGTAGHGRPNVPPHARGGRAARVEANRASESVPAYLSPGYRFSLALLEILLVEGNEFRECLRDGFGLVVQIVVRPPRNDDQLLLL